MRVLVAGATGVVGARLVPLLRSAGHEVIALARSRARVPAGDGAWRGVPVVCVDALDPVALRRAVGRAAPDAVVHLLTAVPAEPCPRRMRQEFALTNRLRSEGTRNLLAAATASGVRRVVVQSVAFGYRPGAPGEPAGEDVPLWDDAPAAFAEVLDAVGDLEEQTRAAGGLVLRFGHLYGPGAGFAPDGGYVRAVRRGALPLVGDGGAVFSFTHTRDAATAVAAALRGRARGVLNVVDDDPAPVARWLPELARLLGARPPRRVPALLARPAVGLVGLAFMTRLRGAANDRARLVLGWRPRYASWRDGFAAELGSAARHG
jgi:nucleoside-diphosphate-sugar epimerase